MNLGSNSCNLNRNNGFFILGLYFKVSILNTSKTFLNLKKRINFLVRYSKKLSWISFLIININKNKILAAKYKNACSSIKCSYYNGSWWNGLLKSFKKYIRYGSYKKNKKFKFFNNQYPNFSFYIDRYKHRDYENNVSFIGKEMNDTCMPSMMFFTDHINFNSNPAMTLTNTRTYINNLYLFNISFKIAKKCLFVNKKIFFSNLFSKYKVFNIKKFKLFYEYNYCFINKKNFIYKTSWSGDLE